MAKIANQLFQLEEVTDPQDLAIGKKIRCHYQAKSNEVGVFSGLGEETSNFIPPESSATPSGDFYFICVDRDYLGRWKLIADRDIQHSISWDTLNSEGVASGSGVPIKIEYDVHPKPMTSNTDTYIVSASSENKAYYTSNCSAFRAFNKEIGNSWCTEWRSLYEPSLQSPQWIKIDLRSPKLINKYKVLGTNLCSLGLQWTIRSWELQGSNDNQNWDILDSQSNVDIWGHREKREYYLDNIALYRYYRLLITENQGGEGAVGVGELTLLYGSFNNHIFSARLLTGGVSSIDKDNEWDEYIVNSDLNGTIEAGDNNVWNWSNQYSLCSTTALNISFQRVLRGKNSENHWTNGNTDGILTNTVFRPVLLIEPKNRNKSFILYEDEAYYYNDGWVNLGAIPDDAEEKKQLFEQYGMEHDITGQQLKELKEMLSE